MRAGKAVSPGNVAPPPPLRMEAQAFQQKAAPAAGYRTAPGQTERNDCRLPRRVAPGMAAAPDNAAPPPSPRMGAQAFRWEQSCRRVNLPRPQATRLLRGKLSAMTAACPGESRPEWPLLRATSLPRRLRAWKRKRFSRKRPRQQATGLLRAALHAHNRARRLHGHRGAREGRGSSKLI